MRNAIRVAVFLSMSISAFAGDSDDFVRIERLSERVVLGYRLGTGRMNIVAVESQKGLVVIDTGMSPRVTAPVKAKLEKTLKRDDWKYVINTHAHMHHAGGNCLFRDAVVIGHENLPRDMQWLIDRQTDERAKREALEFNAETIRKLRATLLQVAGSRLQTRMILGEIKFFGLNTLDVEEGFEIVRPSVTFSDRYMLDLGDIKLELIYFGKGHSLSDILIHIPQEGVLVTGAIVYLRGHLPGISELAELKDVHRYLAVLNSLLEEGANVERVVTSHSRVLNRNDLRLVRDYYQAMLDGVKAARQEGLTLEQTTERLAVRNNFPHYYQVQTAQWSEAKQNRNITVLWNLLAEQGKVTK